MTPNPQQHERDIDQALGSLRSAQPTPGNADEALAAMNARLLRGLRASAGRNGTRQTGWLCLPRIALAVAAVAAVWVGALLLPTLRTTPGAPSVTASSSRVGSAERQPLIYQSAQRGPSKPGAPSMTALSSRAGSARPTTAPSQSAGLDPAFLPSSPAPEQPLTRQEKLMLSIANRRDLMLIALLEPGEPDLFVLRRPTPPNPLFAGFQPESQPAASAPQNDVLAIQASDEPDAAPQTDPQP